MSESSNFLAEQIQADLEQGTYGGRVVTRFPPEPNGFLHIGHAKAIVVDFGLAQRFGGRCHLRFDDTNPVGEDTLYVESIQRDVRWLGYEWGEHLYYASDYFPKLFAFAERLIREGRAYVCSLSLDQIRETRGTVTEPGTPSPDRDRPVQDSLRLLREMREGKHAEGAYTVRAKIDMAHPNMKMRDPLMYRIRHAHHHRTGDSWHIYPMYDFAHGLSDAIEGITHSFCTLEFENNRALYDWFVEAIFEPPVPHQYEMARLNLSYVVLSKRKLITLVREGHVWGWDDPRMPTLAGLRRRGVPPEAVVAFVEQVGVSRADSLVDVALLDHTVRDYLNTRAPRRMGVLDPLPVTLTNIPEGEGRRIELDEWPHDIPRQGSRAVPLTRHLVIEREDFAVDPPKGFKRLTPGGRVRLRGAGLFTCEEVLTDQAGQITGLRGRLDPEGAPGPKVAGTIHWSSATAGVEARVLLVDRLFTLERPDDHPDGALAVLNPDSLVERRAVIEPALAQAPAGTRVQLERLGYFIVDEAAQSDQPPTLIRIVPLKDSWAAKASPAEPAPPPAKKDPGRKRVRKSASEALQELIEVRPEIADRLDRLEADGLSEEDAAVIGTDDGLFELYAQAVAQGADQVAVVNWIVNDLRAVTKERPLETLSLTGAALAELIALVTQGEITTAVARKVFARVIEGEGSPIQIVDRQGLRPIRDPARIEAWAAEVVQANPDKVQAYRQGRTNLRGFFVGQVMRASRGKADPAMVNRVLDRLLAG
ncbi:MAG: glutamine--tRNA ligase/YqeY domain fusion protein [Deltaproteobacteria bacterium]|nr:MAG: glutamine--tRNA ligase/YqeY domain fusion protein [Deltaproteobacteria bacterium]